MNNMQKSFKQKAQLGMRAANPIQKMQLGATPHMGSGKPPRMASGLAQRFADGGRVHGMGGPTQDKVSAKLSPGEYVLPADTVAAVGAHNLDGLRAATHVPVAPNAPNHFANGGQPVNPNEPVTYQDSPAPNPITNPRLFGRIPSSAPATPTVAPAVSAAPTSPIVRDGNSFSNISSSPAPLAPTVPAPATAPVAPIATAAPAITPSAQPATVSNGQVGRSAGLIPTATSATPASTFSSFLHGVDDVAPRNKASGVGLASAIQGAGGWLAKQKANSDAEFSKNPTLNNAGVINPWAEIPFVGPVTAGVEAAADAAPGLVGKGIGALKSATNWLGGKLPGAEARAANSAATAPIGAVATPLMAHDFVGPPTSAILTGMRAQAAQNAKAFVGPPTRGAINAAAGYVQRGVGTALRATTPQSLGAIAGSIPENGNGGTPTTPSAKAAPAAAAATPAIDPALAAQQAATTLANAALPAGLKDARGNLNGDAIFSAQPSAIASAPIAAAQTQQVQSAMQQGLRAGSSPVSGDGTPIATTARYADPAAAEAYYRNRTESQLSPQGVAESNAFARAQTKGMNASTLARDNAAYASRGMNVTRSSDGKGGVLYSDAPNPYMNSKFTGGRTGNDIAADNKAQENIGLQEAQIRQQAHADDAVLAQRQQLMDAVKNAPSVARQNAAISALSVFNQNNGNDKDRVERAQERAASLEAAKWQYRTQHEQWGQTHALDLAKQGFTEHEARQKQNDDVLRARYTLDGKLNSAEYLKAKQYQDAYLASKNQDAGGLNPELAHEIALSYEMANARPMFDSVKSLVGAGAPNSNTPQQSRFIDKRSSLRGEELQRADGTWVLRRDANGAGFFGGNADAAKDAVINKQLTEYEAGLNAAKKQ